MTACAMTVGMVPMALALERGSQMQAPLGRAVIGGLVMSTFATLLVVPSIFALVIGRSVSRSPSIYPADPQSTHFDPLTFSPTGELISKVVAEVVADAGQGDEDFDSDVVTARRLVRPTTHPQNSEQIRTPGGGPESAAAQDGTSQLPPSPGDV
jgi:hypothetical protein